MRAKTPFGVSVIALATVAGPVLHAGDCEPQQATKLTPSDGGDFDEYGDAVAIDGDVLVIGAVHHTHDNIQSGAAYVYRRDGKGVWVEEAELVPADAASRDKVGQSVAISGDVIVVGAHWDDDNGVNSGSAYVFRHVGGGVWSEEDKLLADDGAMNDYFGFSVSVCGDVAVIGAHWDDDGGNNTGSAYVFRHAGGGVWALEDKIARADPGPDDYFAWSVAVSGDVAVVGAYRDDDNGAYSGSAYVFRNNGGVWGQEEKLLPADGADGDNFGWSVAIAGDAILISAWADGDNGVNSGSAYVFRDAGGGTWIEEDKLLPGDGSTSDYFGRSVSISGGAAVVGAYQDDDNGNDSGSAYVFVDAGNGTWPESAKLVAADGTAFDGFGEAVAVSGSIAVVGASLDDDNNWMGSAYVYDIGCDAECPADLDGSGEVGFADVLRVLAAWGNDGGPEDIDGDGTVNFNDLLLVLAAWGPCS